MQLQYHALHYSALCDKKSTGIETIYETVPVVHSVFLLEYVLKLICLVMYNASHGDIISADSNTEELGRCQRN